MINSITLASQPNSATLPGNRSLLYSMIADVVVSIAMVAITTGAHYLGVGTEVQNALIGMTVVYGTWTACRVKHILNIKLPDDCRPMEHVSLHRMPPRDSAPFEETVVAKSSGAPLEEAVVKIKDPARERSAVFQKIKNVIAALVLLGGVTLIGTAFTETFSDATRGILLGASFTAVAWATSSLVAACLHKRFGEHPDLRFDDPTAVSALPGTTDYGTCLGEGYTDIR